jgi:hypothetical protein
MPAVRTQLAKKRKESEALASCIKRTSFEMFPCSGYEKRNLTCIVLDKETSSRCSECVLHKVSCNVEGILVGEWRTLELETDCLKHKKAIAFSQIGAAQRLISENLARLQHFEKQEKFLKSKGKDMVCHSLKTLDKLEEVEEKEKQMEEERAASKAAATAYALVPLESDPFAKIEIPLLLLKVWGDWDFASETLQVS